jgi:hypothetical protein
MNDLKEIRKALEWVNARYDETTVLDALESLTRLEIRAVMASKDLKEAADRCYRIAMGEDHYEARDEIKKEIERYAQARLVETEDGRSLLEWHERATKAETSASRLSLLPMSMLDEMASSLTGKKLTYKMQELWREIASRFGYKVSRT